MKKKSKIIAGGILITSAIGATTFAIMDPYNILTKKNIEVPEKSLKFIEHNDKNKDNIYDMKELDNINLKGIKDGTYLGISKGYGGDIKVKVTIKDGKIKNVEVVSHSETPKYYENGKKIIDSIIKKNSINVDAISGATLTSNGIKNAVKMALSKAGFNIVKNNKGIELHNNDNKYSNLKTNNFTTNIKKSINLKEYSFKDGEYIGEAIGFKGNVKVKVKISAGKLSNIKIISHNDDNEFFNKAKGVIIKILKEQGTSAVDTISGATYSSIGILNSVNDALSKAKIHSYKKYNNVMDSFKIKNIHKKNNENLNNINNIEKVDNKINQNNNIKYLDGKYIGIGYGFTNKPIKSEVIFKNNKIKSIDVATKESGNYGDDSGFFRKTAVKIVPFLQKNFKETIEILLLHDKLVDKILKSKDYYIEGKKIIDNYAENLKNLSKDLREETKYNTVSSCVKNYLKAYKNTNIFDVVSGATYSAKGIARSVEDAMNKSANDFKTKNTINDLKIISPINKIIEANKMEKLDLSKLKVIISNKNGSKKEIEYNKFKENDIEIYDKNTKKPIYNGMDLNEYQIYHGIDCIIEHKKSSYKDEFLIIPIIVNKNYITGIEYSIDQGENWNKFNNLKKYKNNINFAQDLKISKKNKGKNLLLRLVSINNNRYLLELEDKDKELKVDNKEYYLKASDKERASNINIPSTLRFNFNFEEDKINLEGGNNNIDDKKIKLNLDKFNYKDIKYLDGSYTGIGYGFTGKPIKSEVTLINNKINNISVASIESGNYGDDGEGFRNRAMKIIPYLKENPQKIINELSIHDKMINEILKSDNYYEKGKELIGDYAEKLKTILNKDSKDEKYGKIHSCVRDYLKENNKINIFDVVSGATYSAKGIARSVEDAMNKSANDFKTGNVIDDLKIKTPTNKCIEVDLKGNLDLSKLKVIISNKNGTKKEIEYNKFKENGIEVYDKNTKKPIYNGMKLETNKEYHGIYAIIEHKKSLYKDEFLILPINSNRNYITGIEYSFDEGKNWSRFDDLKKYRNNIDFKQELKIQKRYKDKKILLRLVTDNNKTYLLKPDEKDVILRVRENEEYYLEVNSEDKKNNGNIPSLLRIKFKYI